MLMRHSKERRGVNEGDDAIEKNSSLDNIKCIEEEKWERERGKEEERLDQQSSKERRNH